MSAQQVANPVLGVIARMRLQLDSLESWAIQSSTPVFKMPDTTVTQIINAVCLEWGITAERLKERTKCPRQAFPRQVAMFICWRYVSNASLPFLGKELGGFHHTTVLSSVKKIEQRMYQDVNFKNRIERVIASLNLTRN